MRRRFLILALCTLACTSTDPGTPGALQLSGQVEENGFPPTPSLSLTVTAWGSDGADSVAQLQTDSLGAFAVRLPSAAGLDSVDLVLHQYDCGSIQDTRLHYAAQLRPAPAALQLPVIAVPYRLPRGQLGNGSAVCGVLASAPGDARLAIWFDQVADSVHGRWRLNFVSSRGDEYGYFHGTRQGDTVVASLVSQPPGGCSGLALRVVAGERPGTALYPASFQGNDTCLLPSTTVRFFEGPSLAPLLPAWPPP